MPLTAVKYIMSGTSYFFIPVFAWIKNGSLFLSSPENFAFVILNWLLVTSTMFIADMGVQSNCFVNTAHDTSAATITNPHPVNRNCQIRVKRRCFFNIIKFLLSDDIPLYLHSIKQKAIFIFIRTFFYDIIATREMRKKIVFLFAVCACMAGFAASAASFQVKKASSVKKQDSSGLESIASNSLLPGVINLVANVSALNKQQKELEAECVPSSQELRWVNDMVKEYAKSGGVIDISDICSPGTNWADEVEVSMPAKIKPCAASVIDEVSGEIHVWNGYPIAEVAKYCADDSTLSNCSSSKRKTVSNIYTIFSAIDFAKEDYTADEASTYVKFLEKMEKCAPENIAARKKEANAGFITSALSNVGQSTNTGGILEAVGGLTSGGGASGIQSLVPAVTQFLDR